MTTTNLGLADVLSLGPVMGFGCLAEQVADPQFPLDGADVEDFADLALPLATSYARDEDMPEVRANLAELGKHGEGKEVNDATRASIARAARALARAGIPEDVYFSVPGELFHGAKRGPLSSARERVAPLLRSLGIAIGLSTHPPIDTMRRTLHNMGFDDRAKAVDEVRGDITAYYANAPIEQLIEDLQSAYRGRNILGEIFAREGIGRFASKEAAMKELGLSEDQRTVHIIFDKATGLVTATHVAGYFDAKSMSAYGLPAFSHLDRITPLSSGLGIAIKYAHRDGGTTRTVQSFYIFRNPPDVFSKSELRKNLVRMREEAMRDGRVDALVQRIRRHPPGSRQSDIHFGAFYRAFHQYLVERGLIDAANAQYQGRLYETGRLTADGVFFAPMLEAGAVRVFLRSHKNIDPGELTSGKSTGIYLEDGRLLPRPSSITSSSHIFTATLRRGTSKK